MSMNRLTIDDDGDGGENPTLNRPDGRADTTALQDDDGDMTNAPDPMLHQPAVPATSPQRRHSAGHIVAIVIGCLVLLPGLGMLAGGGAIAVAQAVATDDDGYFSFTIDRIESEGVAIATTDLWLDDVDGDASPWVLDWLDLDVRLRVEGAGPTDEVFVGIARSADVEDYLADAAYSEVVELDDRVARYRDLAGSESIAPPTDQDFWTVSSAGDGEQEIEWEARGGRWSVVVMNPDGAAEVAADVEIGAKSGAVTPIAVMLLVTGGIVSAAAIVLIVIGARGRKEPGTPASPPNRPVTGEPLPTPSPESAVQLDRQDRQPTSVG